MPTHTTFNDEPISLVVSDYRTEGRDVAVLELRHPHGENLPEWEPGAHIALRLGSDEIVREYSLCSSPANRSVWRIAVRRAELSRGGSDYVHARLRSDAVVEVVRIGNLFPFEPASRPYFVAAGIGITPILPMIESAQQSGADWHLLYIGRHLESMPFLNDLSALSDRVTIVETSTQGRVNIGSLVRANADAHFYACGPESLLDDLEQAVRASGPTRLSVERFTPRGVIAGGENSAFTIVVESSGQLVPVLPEQTALSALLEAGVRVRNSCGEGTCGSCEVVVLDGVPDHRDSILTDEELISGDCMYVCVSRSRTATLTLDL